MQIPGKDINRSINHGSGRPSQWECDSRPIRGKADCLGNTLRLYANGILLGEVTDSDFSSGFSGMIAAALDSPRFEVVFNNFLITASTQ